MPADSNRIEFDVPKGTLVVRHAHCPKGCDLMDPEVKIHDNPSIHLVLKHEGKKADIHLDPVYGSHENICEHEVPKGAVVELFCPSCGMSLTDPEATCAKCSAPMFILHLPKGSFVEACQRSGCPHHRVRIVTGEQMMQRLFDEVGMDSYL
ncbi:MAG: hypothetical protein KAY24_06045 [Candidatus Eisenbacteria sp.]|nr:hypothetical protein [Candidatus Eisenbacteria bacterium]